MRPFPASDIKEFKTLKKLDSPWKVQDFIERLPINFELGGDTCRSPLMALRHREAHCMEGALLAATAFWIQGEKPLLLDLKTNDHDESHVIALFKWKGLWGAVSKTNHAILRYRDPVYRTVRELAMSYFNEYFLDDGIKTLRSFSSSPFSLLRYGRRWLVSDDHLFDIVEAIDFSPHTSILGKGKHRLLRLADPIERGLCSIVQWEENE